MGTQTCDYRAEVGLLTCAAGLVISRESMGMKVRPKHPLTWSETTTEIDLMYSSNMCICH